MPSDVYSRAKISKYSETAMQYGKKSSQSHNFVANAECHAVVLPVGAEHFETANLRRGAHMLADARAHVVVADAHQAYGVARVVGQTVERNAAVGRIRLSVHDDALELGTADKFERDGHVLVDELVHLALNGALLLTVGLVVEYVCYLTLLALDVGVVGALASEHAHHQLVEQMLGGVGGGKLVFVVVVEVHISLNFEL